MFALFLPSLGHWVESAGDAGTALERLRQGGFDVLLTDLWQPNAHGWCLLQELRVRGDLPPHVVSTGAGVQPNAVQLSRAAGCCAHLAQPFWLSEVERTLAAIRLVEEAPPLVWERTAEEARSIAYCAALRAERLELRTESRLLCAIVARNIALCGKAVEEARRNHTRWREKSLP